MSTASKADSYRRWHRLDNTANLFPVITTKSGPNVYRISITLKEAVVPELLQQALVKALPWFNAFRVRLRHGLFWYYLDENTATPRIGLEDDWPCRAMVPQQNEDFLFRVSYFSRRINLEAFHVLADGAGALQFLQAICCQYLMLAHPAAFSAEDRGKRWFATHAANTEDSYAQNYTPTKKTNFNLGSAYRLKGERTLLNSLGVMHAYLDIPQLLAHCRGLGVSITQYLTACIGWAVYTQQLHSRPARHPVRILLPVNLRNYFESNTTLNFFSNAYITLPFNEENVSFEQLLAAVKAEFGEALNRESMLQRISYTVGSGYSPFIRALPLPIKNIGLRILYQQGSRSSTLSFSNVGTVNFPDRFAAYVDGAAVLLSTSRQEPFKVAAMSFGQVMTLTFTSSLRSVGLQRAVVRKLAEDGLDVTLSTNGVDYESL